MPTAMVPTQFAASLIRMAAARGFDFGSALTAAGLDFDPLDESAAGWQAEITAMQYSQLYQKALRLLQDETFGMHPHKVVSPGAFRMMCYCIIHSENLGKAISRASDFYRTFFGGGAELYANFTDRHARVGYRDMPGSAMRQVGAADAYGLSVWHRFFGWLSGRPIDLQRVDFAGDPPRNPAKYEDLFGCPIYYNQASNLMYFDSECLRYPLVHTEQSLHEFLRTAPYQLMVMTNDQHSNSLVAQLRAMIGYDFSQGFPSFETLCAALNMSAPTLRRRLKREGTTFQQLKDQCRCEAALALLDNRALSINQVAAKMGFTDPSAFHRSFKKWTGQTPGDYRSSLAGTGL
ncbi:AraC family transcriptional regulator [Candidatus Litorirhabdus singularis]|nr:AraC family transcriptional regulator [Candidatus Litorirhabdus singularis]